MFTCVPKDPNCVVCKAATARCKKRPQTRSDGILCLARFLDLMTVDHAVLTEERESQERNIDRNALIVQDFVSHFSFNAIQEQRRLLATPWDA